MSEAMTHPLRIAHLSFSSRPGTVGGLETVVDSLIRSQIEAGHQVSLVTRWKQAQAFRRDPLGYPVHALPPRRSSRGAPFREIGPRWPVALAVAALQLRYRFDVWHAHWLYPTGWMAQGVLERLGVPLVMTAHGADVNVDLATGYGFRQFPRHDARIRALASRTRWITGVSPQICAELEQLGATAPRIIGNGIGFAGITSAGTDVAATRARLGVPENAALLLTVSRNDPSKGLHHIPEVLRQLTDAGVPAVWAIVGPGSEALAPLFAEVGVADRVRLLPAIHKPGADRSVTPPRELVDLYKSAELFVFPTHAEAFGLVALEAMAAGTATVASDVGGLRSFLRSGENGLLVPPGQPKKIADAVTSLLRDERRRLALAEAGQETARRYDWPAVAAEYVALYRETLSGASA